jgi:hypothetical protein
VPAVKLQPEDNPQKPIDPFLQLLHDLWRSETSVNQLVVKGELRVYPQPSEEMADRIRTHFYTLRLWLSGVCDNCHAWVMTRTEAYWGSHAHYCPNCMEWAIDHFEEHDRWPEATWHEGEA